MWDKQTAFSLLFCELPHHLIREQAHRRMHLIVGHAAEGEIAAEVFDAARLQCFYLGDALLREVTSESV